MSNLSLENDTSSGFDSSVSLMLAKPTPLSFDLSELLNSKISYTPSSQSTYDSISIKAEEDIFRPISSGESNTTKEFQELATVVQVAPQRITLGDFVTKRPYNKRPKTELSLKEVKKESTKRKSRVTNIGEPLVKKEKLMNGVSREVAVIAEDKSIFPEIVLKDGKIQIADSLPVAEKAPIRLEIVQAAKKKVTTSISFKQVNHTEKWTETENEKFYRALELFGTEFSMIAKVFKNRDRNQIKNKFLREEKMFPDKINTALKGSGGMNFHTLLQKFNRLRNNPNKNTEKTSDNNSGTNLLIPHLKQEEEETGNMNQRERSGSCISSESIDSVDRAIMEDLSDIFQAPKGLLNM